MQRSSNSLHVGQVGGQRLFARFGEATLRQRGLRRRSKHGADGFHQVPQPGLRRVVQRLGRLLAYPRQQVTIAPIETHLRGPIADSFELHFLGSFHSETQARNGVSARTREGRKGLQPLRAYAHNYIILWQKQKPLRLTSRVRFIIAQVGGSCQSEKMFYSVRRET